MTNLPIAEGHEDLGQRTKTVYLITSEVNEVGVLKLDPGTPHKEVSENSVFIKANLEKADVQKYTTNRVLLSHFEGI